MPMCEFTLSFAILLLINLSYIYPFPGQSIFSYAVAAFGVNDVIVMGH